MRHFILISLLATIGVLCFTLPPRRVASDASEALQNANDAMSHSTEVVKDVVRIAKEHAKQSEYLWNENEKLRREIFQWKSLAESLGKEVTEDKRVIIDATNEINRLKGIK